VATEPAPTAGAPDERPDLGDIRRSRPYILSRAPLRYLAFRTFSVLALIVLDVCGLAIALYLALALRELYYGKTEILWGLLWDAESEWLPFVVLVTVLVFSQARLYARRERRPGFGRIVSSLLLVALLTFAFGVGTGHEFGTFGLIPTTTVIAMLLIGLLRASYDVVTREVLHLLGVRRRVVLAGEGEHLSISSGRSASRSGIDYEIVGVVSRSETDVPFVLGTPDALRAVPPSIRDGSSSRLDFGGGSCWSLSAAYRRACASDPNDGAPDEARRFRARKVRSSSSSRPFSSARTGWSSAGSTSPSRCSFS
jgi:hypothetical protein